MDATKMNALREQAQSTNVEVDRELVLELISTHEAQQRAESFWSVRAPALNDEVVALRQVESSARALRTALATAGAPAGLMGEALQELDVLRLSQGAA